ncbi:hypothetical protein GCM10018785_43450 [Streptomyces longispororuber]|uniref:Uncharacterized protein n=1 Tax=Streptomyces longispororuber TaxID=68230 RepID=A0A918ZVV5_9ACTN|nr:hypothetical protein GCM10018785_43450 [Streptomyces longispororuber]
MAHGGSMEAAEKLQDHVQEGEEGPAKRNPGSITPVMAAETRRPNYLSATAVRISTKVSSVPGHRSTY